MLLNDKKETPIAYPAADSRFQNSLEQTCEKGNGKEDYPQVIARICDLTPQRNKRKIFFRYNFRFTKKNILTGLLVFFCLGGGLALYWGLSKEPVTDPQAAAADDFQPAVLSSVDLKKNLSGDLAALGSPMVSSGQDQNILSSDLSQNFDTLPDFKMLAEASRKESGVISPEKANENWKNGFENTALSDGSKENGEKIPNWNDLTKNDNAENTVSASAYPSQALPPIQLNDGAVNEKNAANKNFVSQGVDQSGTGLVNNFGQANQKNRNNIISNNGQEMGNGGFTAEPRNNYVAFDTANVRKYDAGQQVTNNQIDGNPITNNQYKNNQYAERPLSANSEINSVAPNSNNYGQQTNLNNHLLSAGNRFAQTGSEVGFQGYQQTSETMNNNPVNNRVLSQGVRPNEINSAAGAGSEMSVPPFPPMNYSGRDNSSMTNLNQAAPLPNWSGRSEAINPVQQNQVHPIQSQFPPQSGNVSPFQPTGYSPTVESVRNGRIADRTASSNTADLSRQNTNSRFQGYSVQSDQNPISYSSNADFYDNSRSIH